MAEAMDSISKAALKGEVILSDWFGLSSSSPASMIDPFTIDRQMYIQEMSAVLANNKWL